MDLRLLSISPPAPASPGSALPVGSVPAAAPAPPAYGGDALVLGGGAASASSLATLRLRIEGGMGPDAVSAVYELEPFLKDPATRAAAAALLVVQIKAGATPEVKAAAADAAKIWGVSEAGAQPAAASTPSATPAQPASMTSVPTAAPTAASGAEAEIMAALTVPATAPAAMVRLAQMPAAQAAPILEKCLAGGVLGADAMDLAVAFALKHASEPAFASTLARARALDPQVYPAAAARMAQADAAAGNIGNQAWRALLSRAPGLTAFKTAILQALLKNPAALRSQQAAVVLKALAAGQESSDIVNLAKQGLAAQGASAKS